MISIETNVNQFVKFMGNMQKQVNFGTANAINKTAKHIQVYSLTGILPKALTLRAKWQEPGSKFGFNIKPFANKNSLSATIGSQANWLKLQEEGGDKKGNGHRVAIPSPFWKKREEIMKRQLKPKAILGEYTEQRAKESRALQAYATEIQTGNKMTADNATALSKRFKTMRSSDRSRKALIVAANRAKKKAAVLFSLKNTPFIATMKSGHEGIFVRSGPDPKGKAKAPVKILFSFRESSKQTPRLKFETQAEAEINRIYDEIFTRELKNAFATMKI